MNQTIPSSHVGVKINEWYKMIRQFSIPDAEILKAEVEQEIQQMEEDQDLLIYYSLMCFRHQMMLDYLEPVDKYLHRPTTTELLKKIETSQKKLSGMLHYYSFLFRGMYEFSKKEYLKAIGFYWEAEQQLFHITDDIEQAEFHFKLAEAYYGMKQSHVSMHHVSKALEIYNQYELYKVRKVQCLFVIAGNYEDFKCYDKCLPHLEKALELSNELQNARLISSALYNIGKCYGEMENFEKAEKYIEKSVRISDQAKLNNLPHSMFTLAKYLFKQGKSKCAAEVSNKGLAIALQQGDGLFVSLQQYLKALYIDAIDQSGVKNTIQYLEKRKNYSYVEDIALDTATVFAKANEFEQSHFYYQKMIETQNQIQRGECLYEI
ncbi:response regulator aspartate phosphatase [Bacillus atrophaeus]|uniref:response regulator aspartate phosphatase n=1 Tax=Bacillus atrophaeus TaxID=1452 RepID=UPI001C116116|nr:tetratricopeptide repeat protein [Bacillus atrophaeus]MBU5262307.1 tetratricopeptide repeat protein [Bacillus atrophaeus]